MINKHSVSSVLFDVVDFCSESYISLFVPIDLFLFYQIKFLLICFVCFLFFVLVFCFFVKQIITFNLNWLHNKDEVPIRRKSMQKHASASETMYMHCLILCIRRFFMMYYIQISINYSQFK